MTKPDINRDYVCKKSFRMGRGDFARTLFMQKGLTPICMISLVLLVGFFVGLAIDLRFLILSAMIVFIIIPLIIGFLYYYYALDKYYRFNVVDHNITMGNKGLTITMFFPLNKEEEADEENDCQTSKESHDEADYKVVKQTIDYAEIGMPTYQSKSVIYRLGKKDNGFLWIPESAFETTGDFQKFIDNLNGKLCGF